MTVNRNRGRFVLIAGAMVFLYIAAGGILRNGRGSEGTATAFTPAPERRAFTPLQGITISDNTPWVLSSMRGRIVLLNYAATWCAPCRRETPDLVTAANRYRNQGFEVVGLMMDEGSRSAVHSVVGQYADQYDISYPLIRPVEDTLLLFTGLGLPTSILLDRQGCQVRTYIGPVSLSTLTADIERLLQEKDPATALPPGHKS